MGIWASYALPAPPWGSWAHSYGYIRTHTTIHAYIHPKKVFLLFGHVFWVSARTINEAYTHQHQHSNLKQINE